MLFPCLEGLHDCVDNYGIAQVPFIRLSDLLFGFQFLLPCVVFPKFSFFYLFSLELNWDPFASDNILIDLIFIYHTLILFPQLR